MHRVIEQERSQPEDERGAALGQAGRKGLPQCLGRNHVLEPENGRSGRRLRKTKLKSRISIAPADIEFWTATGTWLIILQDGVLAQYLGRIITQQKDQYVRTRAN